MLSILIDPCPHSPSEFHKKDQVPKPEPFKPRDIIDKDILAEIRSDASRREGYWDLVNKVTCLQNPTTRSEARYYRTEVMNHIRDLLKMGILFRAQFKQISTKRPEDQYWIPRSKHRPIPRSTDKKVSASNQQVISRAIPSTKHSVYDLSKLFTTNKVSNNKSAPVNTFEKAKSAEKTIADTAPKNVQPLDVRQIKREQVSRFAKALAKLRHQQKNWTGYIQGQPIYHGQIAKLADGRWVKLDRCEGGTVFYRVPYPTAPGQIAGQGPSGYYQTEASNIQLTGNLAARVLGHLKRGCKERPSAAKMRANRQNSLKAALIRHQRKVERDLLKTMKRS